MLAVAGFVGFYARAGLPWTVGMGFLALYLLTILALTRLQAEAGAVWLYGSDLAPLGLLTRGLGSANLSPRTLTMLSFLQWFDCDNRNLPMPQHLEAFKIASSARMQPRPVFGWILIAAVLGIVTSWVALLSVYYQHGAATAKISQWHIWRGGKFPFEWLMGLLLFPQPPDPGMWRGVGFGFGFALFCTLMRFRFLRWPFHPLGYALAVANPWTMGRFWLPFLLGWLAKLLTIRYGGLRAYRRALPFFLGLILGDYVMGALWAIVGAILSVPVYSPFFERW